MKSKLTVSREEYRQWVEMLKDKQQPVACTTLRRPPRPASLALPTIATEVPSPFQARVNRPTVPVLSADGRPVGRRHIVNGFTPLVIDQSDTIRCAITGRIIFIAPLSQTDRADLGAAAQLNPTNKPTLHQVVIDFSATKTPISSRQE